ncbi:MAG: hypothetical protein KF681_09305 [Bdellovibrionaceae bacterium]|nr:hypothetical protein [Pseudobdellovibrionaceae bacterium]
MTKASKKKTSKKTAPKAAAKKTSKKAAPKKAKTQGRSAAAALRMIDTKLAEFTPALKQRLSEMQTQIQTGDLRSLGMKVLERAKEISGKIKETAAPPARGSKKK